MKIKQKKRRVYILVGIFIFALFYGLIQFIHVDFFLQTYFRFLPLNRQQKLVRTVGRYVSPFAARSLLTRLHLSYDAMHDIAPVLGEVAYSVYGEKGFSVCDGQWVKQCMRGVMTGKIQQFGYTPEVLHDAAIDCTQYSVGEARKECTQATGYTILWQNLYWYIESLQFCDRVFSDLSMRYNCWLGVSHENVNRAGDSLHGLYEVPWTFTNLHYPCDAIPLEYQPACVTEQVKVVRKREFHDDVQKSIDYCMYFTHLDTQKACMFTLMNVFLDEPSHNTSCQYFPKVYRESCVGVFSRTVGRSN